MENDEEEQNAVAYNELVEQHRQLLESIYDLWLAYMSKPRLNDLEIARQGVELEKQLEGLQLYIQQWNELDSEQFPLPVQQMYNRYNSPWAIAYLERELAEARTTVELARKRYSELE